MNRPFKAGPVHGTGDDRGANAPGGGVEHQLLKGIAGSFQIHGGAFGDHDGEIELRARDNALGVQLFISFRAGVIQHPEAQRNRKGRHNIVYIITDRPPVRIAQRDAVKAADAAAAADSLLYLKIHVCHPFIA